MGLLKIIRVGGEVYLHMFNAKDDSTSFCDDGENVIYRVNKNGEVFDATGNNIGRFKLVDCQTCKDHKVWIYQQKDGFEYGVDHPQLLETEQAVFGCLMEMKKVRSL